MSEETSEIELKAKPGYLKAIPIVTALFAVGGGAVSLAGWVFSINRFTDWENDGIQIKANAAISVLLAGIALLIVRLWPEWKVLIRGFASAVVAIAGLTLLQHLTGLNFRIDTLLSNDVPNALATASPGRMGIPASSALTSIGLALIFTTLPSGFRRWAAILGVTSLVVSSLSLTGYFFGANQLYSIPAITGIALQTAMLIAALSIGVAASVPEFGLAAGLSRPDAGGVMLRRLTVPVILISLILGFFRVKGQTAGLYDTAFGTALRTLVEIILLIGILWWTARGISLTDAKVRESAAELKEREERHRSVLESLTDMFMSFDADLRFDYLNASARELFALQGFSEANFVGQKVFDILPQARDSELGRLLERVAIERQPQVVESYYPPFDRYFYARYFPLDDGGVSVFALDVTERKRAEKLADRRFQELGVLYNLADRLNHSRSLDDVYQAALDALSTVLGCERTSIHLFDENGVMGFAASRGLSREYKETVTGYSPWKLGQKRARPIGIYDVDLTSEPEYLKVAVEAENIQSFGMIPLISDETLIGNLTFYYQKPHVFTDAEFEIGMTIGQQIASTIERMRTDEELRENEESLRIAMDTGKVGVWDWDILSNRVSWTDSVYQMHGVALGEFDGKLESFSELIHPDDRYRVRRAIERALTGEEQYEIEFRVPLISGKTNWLYTNAAVLRNAAGAYRMIGATVDITDRKNAEIESAKLATIVETSLDAIISVDIEGAITSWNQGAEKLYGYQPGEVIGKWAGFLVPEDRLPTEPKTLVRIRNGETVPPYETVRQKKDGTLLEVSLTISPLREADGAIIGASIIARDISVRKQAELALRESEIMHRLIDAQEAERHRIARDLHDHLGQQLTALRLKLESARRNSEGHAEIEREIEDIQRHAATIDVSVNYLAWELRPTELDHLGLSDALGSFVREWSNTYDIAADFHATLSKNGRLHPELETNLYRIVQEGLNNILKHAGAKNVNVLLELRNDRIDLIIEDDGRGFDAGSRPVKGHKSTGLGLIGMRERTALLGGTLDIETEPGSGTTIFARVPFRSADSNGDQAD